MTEKRILVATFRKDSTDWPGRPDNPARPIYYIHPETGEEIRCHRNDRTLSSDKDYQQAGFEWSDGLGWCWPVYIQQ